MFEPSTTPYRPSPLLIHLSVGLANITFAFTLASTNPALIPAIFAVALTWLYFTVTVLVCAYRPRPGAADALVVGTVSSEQITPLFVLKFSQSSILAILYLNIVVLLWTATFIIFIILSAGRPRFRTILPTITSGAECIVMSYILARAAIAWLKERKVIVMETDQQTLLGYPEQGGSEIMYVALVKS